MGSRHLDRIVEHLICSIVESVVSSCVMSNPLNTSFTLRPSKHGKHKAELTILERQHMKEVPPRVPLQSRFENSGITSVREFSQHHPPLKRQRLFMDRVGVTQPVPLTRDGIPPPRYLRCPFTNHSPDGGIDLPFQRLPTEFEPPSDENYWQRLSFRMRDKLEESQGRIRDMEEDQRQLRRRILELEEQLLIQSSARPSTYPTSTVACWGRTPDIIVDNHTIDEGAHLPSRGTRGPKRTTPSPEQGEPTSTTGGSGNEVDRDRVLTGAHSPAEMNPPPPTRVVSVPRDSSKTLLASCFYLTDGEGLSDSDHGDIVDDYMGDYDDDIDDDDDRNDSGSHHRG